MAKQKVTITNNSIKSGVTTDVKKAICEFIWNGFDAGAVNVRINYSVNELGGISDLYIEDDGEGISRSSLNETFGKYQDSIKRHSFQWSSQIKGKKVRVDILSIFLRLKQSGLVSVGKMTI